MKGKMIMTLLLSLLSAGALANQVNSVPVQQNLIQDEKMVLKITSPIFYLVPLVLNKPIVTFYVDPLTQSNKKSDTLTVFCNDNEFKISAGQKGTCHVYQDKPSYFGIADKDFKNGTFGTMIFSST